MKRLFFLSICLLLVLIAGKVKAQFILPVRNLQVDYFLNASWDAPQKTILTQDFETDLFPPPGWQERSSHAVGWFRSEGGSSQYFIIPEHTQYAMVNDDAGGPGIDGCCEYLITPALDLSVCDGFKLTFESYFNGNNGQKASVEMSTDNGNTWSLVQVMIHYPAWKQVEIDLSQWSGAGGLSSVLFAFHADDHGNQASGWAIDNVVIQSDSLGVTGYTLLLDQNPIATITETTYEIPPDLVTFGGNYTFCVQANYPAGFADTCVPFTSAYLPPPANLTAASSDSGVWFTWQTPVSASEITSYNIYSDGNIIANVPVAVTTWFAEQEFGETCIEVTAIHNISIYGFPGQLAESVKATACGLVDTGLDLPFTENFSSGTFSLNKWTAGSNWSISGQVGNQAPSVKYESGKSPGSYSSELTSWYFNSLGYDDCQSGYGSLLEFEIKLNDASASASEELIVELVTPESITELKRYKNTGSFDWTNESFDITLKVLDYNFQVRFRTVGENPSNINAWFIDNIKLLNYFNDNWGDFLEVTAKRQGSPENDVKLSWVDNYTGYVKPDYILDDGTVDFWHGTESAQYWQGNEFPVTDQGVLQKASVFLDLFGTSSVCIIDIFDENRNLAGSSLPFIPKKCAFTDVTLPDIPYNGTFYAMFRTVTTGQFMDIALDGTSPYANNELSWIYDGSTWCTMRDCEAVGGVFMIRISAQVGDTVSGPLNPCDILGYNIYRREYSSFPAGPNGSGAGSYNWIGSVPFGTNEFIDRDLSNLFHNCNEYKVTELFAEGESMGSTAWECIYTDTPEPEKAVVNVYPNPASDILFIETNLQLETVAVYNPTGIQVTKLLVSNKSGIQFNVSHFPPGIYSLKCTTSKGESLSRKFVKF